MKRWKQGLGWIGLSTFCVVSAVAVVIPGERNGRAITQGDARVQRQGPLPIQQSVRRVAVTPGSQGTQETPAVSEPVANDEDSASAGTDS